MQKMGFSQYLKTDLSEKGKIYDDWPKDRFAFVTEDQLYCI